jgi:hypothetical protein
MLKEAVHQKQMGVRTRFMARWDLALITTAVGTTTAMEHHIRRLV